MSPLKKYFVLIITALFSLFLFISCGTRFAEIFYQEASLNKRIEPLRDYSDSVTLSDSNHVRVMIITDLQIGDRSTFVPKDAVYKFIEKKQPDMIFVLGDIVHNGRESEYKEYKAFIDDMPTHLSDEQKIPVFCAVGNHDLYNSGWDLYRQYTTPDSNFFRIKTGDVSWYFVDSAGATLGTKQLNFLEEEFQQDPNYKFVLSHYPFYGDEDLSYFSLGNSRERAFLLNLCAKSNVQGIYSGHFHIGGDHAFGPFYEKVVISLCGFRDWKQGWIMLDVNLADNKYTCKEYQWTTGNEYITLETINYVLD